MLENLLVGLGAFAGLGLVCLLPMLLVPTPREWCRTCKHQRYDHADGTGTCTGDEFGSELAPIGTCRCSEYVPNGVTPESD
ncbi:hypothetical protein ACQPZG_01505 (plasmid) [Streptomyces sp. CA-294286]|uniref:hypothetical protein n=1 Tax=Streptomyces sp. CA-294286 TaxID=3240070 RepID=UPI003D8E3ADB